LARESESLHDCLSTIHPLSHVSIALAAADQVGDADIDLDSLLDAYEVEAQMQIAAGQQGTMATAAKGGGQRGKKSAAVERREQAMATPIPEDNLGFSMLSKMGYSAGEGIGRGGAGRAEPIPILVGG
jgi:hypothetical protein